MVDTTIGALEELRHCWSRAVTSLLRGHWLMLDTGFQTTQTILAAATPGTQVVAATSDLPALALARAKKGLAPPPEVYRAPYRDRINWADFPAWARPTDPEVFEGCSHEG